MMKANSSNFPVRMMCRLLEVSPSGYYDWLHHKSSQREKNNENLTVQIKQQFDRHKKRSGAIRITKDLQKISSANISVLPEFRLKCISDRSSVLIC